MEMFMKRIAFFFLLMFSINLFTQTKIDSLETQLKIVTKNEKIDILNELSQLYYEISPQKTIEYSNRALELSQQSNYKEGEAQALKNIGTGNYYQSNYDIALEYYFKSLEIFKELEDKEGASTILNNIGIIYWKLYDFEKALEIYNESLKVMKEFDNKEGIARALNNIGLIHMTLQNYDKALEYFLQSLNIVQEVGNKNIIAYCLNNIGIIYWYLENYDKSLEYYLRSYTINKEIDNKYGIAGSLKNIGGIYVKLEEYDNSIIYYKESLKLAKEIEAKDLIQNIYVAFSELYSVKNDYEKALEYFTLYAAVKDSIFTKESSERIAEMQTKYETEKKEQENEILKKDIEIQRLKINKQQNLRNLLIVISVFILFLAFIIYTLYRSKQKVNFILNQKNIQIEQANKELSEKNKELEIHREHINLINQILRHDIRNNLTVINSAVRLFLKDGTRDMIHEIQVSVSKSLSLINNMREVEKFMSGNKKVKLIDLREVINQVAESHFDFDIDISVSGKAEVLADEAISSVIDNLFNNAIAHGKADKISIEIKKDKKGCEVRVSDNGLGIPKEIKAKLFDEGFTFGEKGHSGLGLYIVKKIMDGYGGSIRVEDNQPKGTVFILTFMKVG
jgi:signal transduction histidine kinase